MELTKYCCPNCFTNKHIKKYVVDNYDYSGNCLYCGHEGVELISIRELGIYIRDCIDKAYERCDEGTGAYYDEEELNENSVCAIFAQTADNGNAVRIYRR